MELARKGSDGWGEPTIHRHLLLELGKSLFQNWLADGHSCVGNKDVNSTKVVDHRFYGSLNLFRV